MPRITKLSELLALMSWVSVFVESWLLLMRRLPVDALSILFFIFFLLIALGVSSVGYNNDREARNKNAGKDGS